MEAINHAINDADQFSKFMEELEKPGDLKTFNPSGFIEARRIGGYAGEDRQARRKRERSEAKLAKKKAVAR